MSSFFYGGVGRGDYYFHIKIVKVLHAHKKNHGSEGKKTK